MTTTNPDRVTEEVLQLLWSPHRVVIVASPPGGGKTGLVERLAWTQTQVVGSSCLIGSFTNQQADQISDRLTDNWQWPQHDNSPAVQRLQPKSRPAGPVSTNQFSILPRPCAWVSTVHRWGSIRPAQPAGLLIIDEAWQIPYALFAPLTQLAHRIILVGDPGQIPPVVTIDCSRWENDQTGPHRAAPDVLMASRSEIPVIRLPHTRRVPQDTVDVIGGLLYPDQPFSSIAAPQPPLDMSPMGPRWGQASSAGRTLLWCEMPEEEPTAQQRAEVGLSWIRGLVQLGVPPERIGVVCPRVDDVSAQAAVLGEWQSQVFVETAERWQGGETDWILAWHPLGGGASGDFESSPGRLCVMLSRHRRGCVLLADRGTPRRIASLGEAERNVLERGTTASWLIHQQLHQTILDQGRLVPPPLI
jgi:hypothetical protein